MRIRPYSIVAVSLVVSLSALLFAAACENFKPYVDPDTVHFDAAVDYGLGPQVTHIGPSAVTCCVEAIGSGAVFYLANPVAGMIDRKGLQHPPVGELHLATPYGVDLTLGEKTPAFGYGFSPDGRTAFYLVAVPDGTYALYAIRMTLPGLRADADMQRKLVIASGLDDPPLDQQSFYTPTGNYLIVGARAKGVMNTPDLHVVSTVGAEDIMVLPNGAFSYLELVTNNDVMIFGNSTASRTPGTPSVEGLYLLNLAAGIGGATPVLIDTHTAGAQLTADGTTLVYQRTNGDLVLWDLATQAYQTVATNVVNYNLGPGRRGPFVWVQNDLSVHVALKQQPEIVTLPAGSIDLASPIMFSPDRQHLYFFKNLNQQSNYGDLYHVGVPPNGNGKLTLVSVRASTVDLYFTNERLLYLNNISNTGDTGDMISIRFDGSDPQPMAVGVATGEVRISYPQPVIPTPPQHTGFYPNAPVPDLSVVPVQPVLANLTNAARDTTANLKFVNTSVRPLLGQLAYGPRLGEVEIPLNAKVHAGQYQFSDDGYVLLYVGDAVYQASAFNYVGSLQLFQTNNNIGPQAPMLTGVAELGPIGERSLFVSAPGATVPGMYFVKY